MQAPKRKTSKSKRDMRRSHHALTPVNAVACSNCGELKLRHTLCPSCGQYRGKQVVEASAE
ncbi:MAG: 50S ribosomal protein L32 [Bdellovibrionales bacterium]|nr:50S ribosomal protein L32 [Bdellovibrionales bacterium]